MASLFWLPSWPYPPAGHGYFSPVTSTINWCEEDYYFSHYSAEIVNSFTNLFFIYLAYIGLKNCIDNKHDKVILVAYITYLMIGVGSFIFHTTLLYPCQLLDELSMIYTACVLFYAVFEDGKSSSTKISLAALTATIAVSVTGWYLYFGDPVFHQNMFALLTAGVFATCVYRMETLLKPSKPLPNEDAAFAKARKQRDALNKYILRNMRLMLPVGVGSIAVAFIIWNLDNEYCSSLRRWRRQVGLPWGIFLEGHGWWHLLSAVSEYYNVFWINWIRQCQCGRQEEFELEWPSWWWSVPKLHRKNKAAKAS